MAGVFMLGLIPLMLMGFSGLTFDRQVIERVFGEYQGAFVLSDLKTGENRRYNPERCEKRRSPCSTFKIVNTLCALENGIVQDQDTVLKWDGRKRPIEVWNRDLSLRDAVSFSAVPHFQQIAAQIGPKRMQAFLEAIDYGNRNITGGHTAPFWLGGSLKISADEQIIFLRRLLQGELPVSDRSFDILKQILKQEETGRGTLYGKTGSLVDDSDRMVLSWFVGFVESHGDTYLFALNISGDRAPGGRKAWEMARTILMDLKLL